MEQRWLQRSQAPAGRELSPWLGGQGGRLAGKSAVPPRRVRTVGAPVAEAAVPGAAIPYGAQVLNAGVLCSAPGSKAARGFGGLPAP